MFFSTLLNRVQSYRAIQSNKTVLIKSNKSFLKCYMFRPYQVIIGLMKIYKICEKWIFDLFVCMKSGGNEANLRKMISSINNVVHSDSVFLLLPALPALTVTSLLTTVPTLLDTRHLYTAQCTSCRKTSASKGGK